MSICGVKGVLNKILNLSTVSPIELDPNNFPALEVGIHNVVIRISKL